MKSKVLVGALVAALASCTGRAAATAAHRPSKDLLVLGASYTQGVGASSSRDGFAYLLGQRLGVPTQVMGASGTGYLNAGPRDQGTFAHRIAGAPRTLHPSLVVLQGGRNDVGYPDDHLYRAVVDTVGETRQRFSTARIVLLGPIPATLPVPEGFQQVDSVLARAAEHCHVQYIDPIAEHWITPSNADRLTGPVPGHPNDLGHAYIANRVAEDLTRHPAG